LIVAQTVWRCSQCGTVNEAGARACSSCGKWPSLFDLQDEVAAEPPPGEPAPFEVEEFEPEAFETETFEPEPFEPADEEAEAESTRSRFPRWIVTAVWVIGLIVWIVVNALSDSG
jgi:hypothetical protein